MSIGTRAMVGLAMAGVLATASATLAQKGESEPPRPPAREVGPFVRAGRSIINVSRVESIEVQDLDDGDQMLTVFLIGRANGGSRVRGRDTADLLRALGVPPIDRARPRP